MASRFLFKSLKNVPGLCRMSLAQTVAKHQTVFTPLSVNTRTFSVSGIKLADSSVYSDLHTFLNQEIKIEQEARKQTNQVTKMKSFDLKADGPNVTLTKNFGEELISVKFNVNHSLDSEGNVEETVESVKENEESPQMKSRPGFVIDIKRKDKVLSFGCSFLPAEESTEESTEPMEDFQIDEFAIHEGEWNENVYSVDCSVLDGQLYDILLNLLEERGMGEQFANDLAEFATSYEHLQYVSLLEKLKEFSK